MVRSTEGMSRPRAATSVVRRRVGVEVVVNLRKFF